MEAKTETKDEAIARLTTELAEASSIGYEACSDATRWENKAGSLERECKALYELAGKMWPCVEAWQAGISHAGNSFGAAFADYRSLHTGNSILNQVINGG